MVQYAKNTKKKTRQGIALVWVSITLIVLLAIVGLMLDWGLVYLVGHQLQNAADSAALAGARYVAWDINPEKINAQNKALEYALKNQASQEPVNLLLNTDNIPEGDIVIGRYAVLLRMFTPTLYRPNAMKVVTRKNGISNPRLQLVFGPIFGFHERNNIQKYAIAMIYGATGEGLIALADTPDRPGLYLNGNFNLDVNGGSIQVNSQMNDACAINGQPVIQADEINIVGEYATNPNYDYPLDETGAPVPINEDVPRIPDPLCPTPEQCLPEPVYDPVTDISVTAPADGSTLIIEDGDHVLQPGYYPGGFAFTGGNIVLEPGIYHLGGGIEGNAGLVIKGSTNLIADGVMFHIVENGEVNISGSGEVHVSPIDLTNTDIVYPNDPRLETYEKVTIFHSRTNFNDARIVGTSLLDLEGTLYFPENHLDLRGEGDGFGNQLIASTIDVRGTGTITINYQGDAPAIANKSFLVE
jgi:hypothetical protein